MPHTQGAFMRARSRGSQWLLVWAHQPPHGDGGTQGTGIVRHVAGHAEAVPKVMETGQPI